MCIRDRYDPEIPVDIYELGLIYKVDVADNKDVTVDMTLTAPACPVAGEMPNMVRDALLTVPGVGEVTVNMTFDPPWTPERMSEEAELELNMFWRTIMTAATTRTTPRKRRERA